MPIVNIASHLKEMARQRPDQIAVMFPVSRDSNGETNYTSYTYQKLDEESDSLAAGLDAIGIGRSVKTVLMVPPSLEFFTLTFALFKAGAVPVLVDPGIGIKNLGKCLAESEPHAFIGVTKAHLARVLFGWGKHSIKQLVTVGRRLAWGGPTWETIASQGRVRQSMQVDVAGASSHRSKVESEGRVRKSIQEHPQTRWQPAATQSEETAAILFTSGSTGVPKGAVYSHGNFAAQVEALKQTFQIQPGEVDLCTFPLFALFAPALGMTAIVPRMDFTKPARVDPREIAEPIQRFKINNLFGSPALLNRVGRDWNPSTPAIKSVAPDPMLRHSPGEQSLKWSSLQRVLSAGAPVSPMILERFSKWLPTESQIFTPYGATESLPVAVIGSHEILRETRQLTAQGAGTCVGRPVPQIQVDIIKITEDPISVWSDDLLVSQGQIGEIVVHGPMVTQEYYRRPDLTALAKIRDPASGRMRHRMGDVGYFDSQGRLWFCGRKSHRVITPNQTYFTEPVEGIFNSHPAVFRTALVGVARNGTREPVLCVERNSSTLSPNERRLTNAQLTSELLEIGAKFELTRQIRTIRFHPRFPVDIRHNSKIFREKLAVWAATTVR